jgi:hypothetical protein
MAPGAMTPGAMAPGAMVPQPAPMMENYGVAPAPAAGCNCQQGGYAPPAASYSAPAYAAGGCATGSCGYGGCDTSAYGYGACNTSSACSNCGPSMGGMLGRGGCGYWFGGVYGLLMDRDNADKQPIAMATPNANSATYPTSNNVVLSSRDADIGYQGGVEFRLGRAFGCNPCTCTPTWGLEAVYWTLFEDSDMREFNDDSTIRTYVMKDLRGIEVDMGSGYRPANHYWDYAPPVQDYSNGGALNQIIVTSVCVHSSFEAQNLELNLLRLSLFGGGYSAAAGYGAMGGYGAGGCGMGGCGGGGSCGGCDSCGGCGGGQRYFLSSFCGVRYMQFDESFRIGADFYNVTTDTSGFLNYYSVVDNNYIGPQIGANGMYRIGCKWGLHLGSAVGVYANDIDVHQYLQSPNNNHRFIGTGENFDAHASKTDVAMIGELRLGASYQATCHLRVYGGWRVLGVTGFAQASDQMPGAFNDAAQLNSYVNSNGSLILHGLQTGLEWNY